MAFLYDIRGSVSSKNSIFWGIGGVVFLFVLWWVLSYSISTERITQISGGDILAEIEDNRYYNNDSLMIAHFDELLPLDDDELLIFGLKKERVFSVIPSPIAVIKSFKELHYDDYLLINISKSIWLNFLGYLFAIFLSIPLGFLLGLNPYFRAAFQKVFDATRFIPLTAVTGIFVLWFGLGNEMKVSFLAFGILVYLVPVVIQRINELPSVYLKTVFTLGANKWQTIKTVVFPYVMSRLIDDIRVLTAISWTYITIAEMLNKNGGIGELIWVAKRQSRLDKAFAILLIIMVIGILQDKVFKLYDKWQFPFKYVDKPKY